MGCRRMVSSVALRSCGWIPARTLRTGGTDPPPRTGGMAMTQVLRGQQGFPTGAGRPPAGPADRTDVEQLPSAEDWQHAEQAEAAVAATRDALAAGRGSDAENAPDGSSDLVREAERIEEEVAPGRVPGDDEPPTEASTND